MDIFEFQEKTHYPAHTHKTANVRFFPQTLWAKYKSISLLFTIGDTMLQEKEEKTQSKTQEVRRAIDSLREELEAVNYYNQRVDACKDEQLKKILLHNAKEEKEHAAMLIEWLRQHDMEFEEELKDYVFTDKEDISSHD